VTTWRCSLREQHPPHRRAGGAICNGRAPATAVPPVSMIEHVFPLAPGGRRGRLLLPEDLTAREGERLCAMVRTLPLPE
jgi:hypothetical protein